MKIQWIDIAEMLLRKGGGGIELATTRDQWRNAWPRGMKLTSHTICKEKAQLARDVSFDLLNEAELERYHLWAVS